MSTLTPDPDHPGLYLLTGPGLTADPDHLGLYLIEGGWLTPDPDHPGLYLLTESDHPVIAFDLDLVYSQNTTEITMSLRGVFDLDTVVGSTTVHLSGDDLLAVDVVRGGTDVDVAVDSIGVYLLELDVVRSRTVVRVVHYPDLSSNAPILLGFSARVRLESVEPLVST